MGVFLQNNRKEWWAQRFITTEGAVDFDFEDGVYGGQHQLWIAAKLWKYHFVLYEPDAKTKFTVYYPDEVIY